MPAIAEIAKDKLDATICYIQNYHYSFQSAILVYQNFVYCSKGVLFVFHIDTDSSFDEN